MIRAWPRVGCDDTLAREWLRSEGFRVGSQRASRGPVIIPAPGCNRYQIGYDLFDVAAVYGVQPEAIAARINAWAAANGHYGRAWDGSPEWPAPPSRIAAAMRQRGEL